MLNNKIIVIGFLGVQTCYLNVDMDEAKRRYCEENDIDEITVESVREFDIKDEFNVYDIWT